MVQVGDEPNVRGAHRRLEAGMVVRPQNAWPSLHHDVKAANQLVGRFLGAGFYYKTFIRPQRLWPAYQKVLSRFAAGGRMTTWPSADRFDQRYAHVDVCVAGGGPAGMAAAIAAAEAGSRVLLVEEEYRLGGHLRYGGRDELAALAELRRAVAGLDNLEVITNGVVAGRYDDNWLAVVERQPASEGRRPALRVRAPRQGPGADARRRARADRASLRVRGQRRARRAALDRRPPPRQPLGGAARRAGGRPHRQRRR